MNEELMTTIQVPVTAREALRKIAEYNRRSSSAQAAWMFERELLRIQEAERNTPPAAPTTRKPVAGVDYDPNAPMSQDDYERLSKGVPVQSDGFPE